VNQRWQTLQGKVDALTVRERALVLLSALAIIYLLWEFVLYQPLAQSKSAVNTELMAVQQKIAAMEQEELIFIQTLHLDPDRELKIEVQDLQNRMAVLDSNLADLSVGLVPADKLAVILQDVLARTESLQLQSLQTLPVERLELNVKTGADGGSAGVYKHSVAITVKGSYFQLLEYLKKLETLTWRFYWDELRYQQESYPNGLFEIRVYTLSTDKGLFGV
jgi:MSHA biogenesis protein MshJ